MTERSDTVDEVRTEAGRRLDLAWPGTHLDRLDWQRAVARVEAEARASAFAEVEEAVKGDAVLRRNALRPYVLAAIADLSTKGGTE